MPMDPTPLGDEMVRRLPEQKFLQPEPDNTNAEPSLDQPAAEDSELDTGIGERPPLPEQPLPMAADVEDEEADPVVDSGPGIADGLERLHTQGGS